MEDKMKKPPETSEEVIFPGEMPTLFDAVWDLFTLHLAEDLLDHAVDYRTGDGSPISPDAVFWYEVSEEGKKARGGQALFKEKLQQNLNNAREMLWKLMREKEQVIPLNRFRKVCVRLKENRNAIDAKEKIVHRHSLRLFETDRQHRETCADYEDMVNRYDRETEMVDSLRRDLEEWAVKLMNHALEDTCPPDSSIAEESVADTADIGDE